MWNKEVAYRLFPVVTLGLHPVIQTFNQANSPIRTLFIAFWIRREDPLPEIGWGCRLQKLDPFREKLLGRIWSVLILHAVKTKAILGPFRLGDRIVVIIKLLEQHIWGSVIDCYLLHSEHVSDLPSGHHAPQKWAAFDDDFVEFEVLLGEIWLQVFTSCRSLFHALRRHKLVNFIVEIFTSLPLNEIISFTMPYNSRKMSLITFRNTVSIFDIDRLDGPIQLFDLQPLLFVQIPIAPFFIIIKQPVIVWFESSSVTFIFHVLYF